MPSSSTEICAAFDSHPFLIDNPLFDSVDEQDAEQPPKIMFEGSFSLHYINPVFDKRGLGNIEIKRTGLQLLIAANDDLAAGRCAKLEKEVNYLANSCRALEEANLQLLKRLAALEAQGTQDSCSEQQQAEQHQLEAPGTPEAREPAPTSSRFSDHNEPGDHCKTRWSSTSSNSIYKFSLSLISKCAV